MNREKDKMSQSEPSDSGPEKTTPPHSQSGDQPPPRPVPDGEPDAPDKPTILVTPGHLHLACDEAELNLDATGRYFVSAGRMVRVVDRPGGGIATEEVNEQTLKVVLSDMIVWQRPGRDGTPVRCDPPYDVVKALLHRQDRRHLRLLNGLARQPYFGVSGQLIDQPGYDAASGIYGWFEPSAFHLHEADRDLAEASLAKLTYLLREFDFETEADLSAALSAILTAVARPSLPVAPAFNITATSSGSGKSYLADIITVFAGPDEPHRVSYPTGAAEAGKLVVSVLMEKPAVVVFDDMQTNWKPFGPLNRALTSASTTERLLGTNRTVTVPTKALFLGTGNNTEPERDMRRRVVSIRLAPKVETPSLRSFQNSPLAALRERRAEAVGYALNIIAAFRAAGGPASGAPSIGTYEEWSRYCREPLIWLGQPDPAQSLIDQVSHDPERESLSEFLDAWFQVFGTASVTVRKLISKADEHPALMDALEELPVMDGRYVNRGKLGWFISKNRGRRAGGFRIEPGDSSERRSWKIVSG